MSDSSSDEDDDDLLDLEEHTAEEQTQEDRLVPNKDGQMASNTPAKAGKLTPLPGTVSGGTNETDLAVVEQMVSGVPAKYVEAPSTESKVPEKDSSTMLRAKSVHSRRGSIHLIELGGRPADQTDQSILQKGLEKLLKRQQPGGVKLSARDHANVEISYWEFDQENLRARAENHPDGAVSPSSGGIAVSDLRPFLQQTLTASKTERDSKQKKFEALGPDKRKELRKKGYWTKADACRWFHLPGCSHKAVDIFADMYRLDPSVATACKAVSGKPICSWHQTEDNLFDHLFVAAHYIQKSTEEAADSISGFVYEQVFMLYYPALNTIISIDANGEKTWDGVTDLLRNEFGFVRTNEDSSVLIYKLLDSMIDEVYPLLDLYGDLLEKLEFETMTAPEPTDEHVRTSFKLKRRVHSLRRYAWGMRQLLQELRQNNFGVITKDTIKMMTSVERNAENMVEVACAYMEQCVGIESFYDSFQEKVQGSTLYILTISSVTIMPFQLLTGLFGMNFVGEDEAQDQMKELHWEHGYQMFWIVGSLVTLLILLLLHRKGVLKSRSISWTNAIDTKDEEERLKTNLGDITTQ